MLEKVNFDEARQSQLPAVELLLALGYTYVSREEVLRQRGGDTSKFILADIAAEKLMEINGYEARGVGYKFSDKDIRDAIDELEYMQYEGLIDTAQKVFNTIMPTSGGKTIRVNVDGKVDSKNFRFIDFAEISKNAFHVTVEYSATGKQTIRQDVVCFVNGIPFAVIENKKSSVGAVEAIRQMNRNQGVEFCPKLFTYTQLLVGSNGKELQYGTTGTPNKFYSVWKEKGVFKEEMDARVRGLIRRKVDPAVYQQALEDLNGHTRGHKQKTDRRPTAQDVSIVSLFAPSRLLDLTKGYTLFEAGAKKLSRYQQYFAIKKILDRVAEEEPTPAGSVKRRGGLVWHTQGSGKSLTMVMFVRALIENPHISNPRVLIVTDRKDLDRQIRDTFKSCNLKKEVIQATSGQHLLDLIKDKNLAVVTTLIHKFETASRKRAGFVDSDKNIFILVDEAHRSQYGDTALEMQRILPNACVIGFTGTPLLKKDKSFKKFGEYIDKYTIDDALEDKVILPLIYEGRYVGMEQNEAQIDKHVDRVSGDLSKRYEAAPAAKKLTMHLQKQITAQIIKNNPQRIQEIARDVETHFSNYFKGSGLKAQIVAPSKYSAVLFQNFFEARGNIRTAVVISDEHEDGDENNSHKKEVVAYLDKIRSRHSSVGAYEKDVIDNFKNYDDGIEIIIVVDKLLTGFDAPRDTVLYLAKDLHDHGLLQAIARVNRLHENEKLPKTAGYIIDYSENALNIDTAMKLFGNYDEGDVKGALIDVREKIQELEQSYAVVEDLLKEAKNSSDDEVYLNLLKDEARRELFHRSVNEFIKVLNECFILKDFAPEFGEKFDIYRRSLKKFVELRKSASLLFEEKVDLSEYKESLVKILDKYVDARGVELLTKQINITDKKQFEEAVQNLGSDKSKAEAIAAQTERTIREKFEEDPEFYERFSKKIQEILEKMRLGKLADIEALKAMKEVSGDVLDKKDEDLPAKIQAQKGADVLYRNLKESFERFELSKDLYVTVILDIQDIVKSESIVDWYKNLDVKRRMMNAIDDYLYDVVKTKKGIPLELEDMRAIAGDVLKLAENNHGSF